MFAELDQRTVMALARIGTVRSEPAGTVLFRQGARGEEFMALLTGSLRVSAETEEGQRITLSILGAGESIGEMALLDDTRRSATVEVMEDATLLVIDRQSFNALITSRPDMALLLLRNLSRRLRQRSADVADIAYLDVYRRLARKLLQLAEEQGDASPEGIFLKTPLTVETLATMIGAEEGGVAQLLTMLENEGTLSHVDNHVSIHDLHRLNERFFTPRVAKRHV